MVLNNTLTLGLIYFFNMQTLLWYYGNTSIMSKTFGVRKQQAFKSYVRLGSYRYTKTIGVE